MLFSGASGSCSGNPAWPESPLLAPDLATSPPAKNLLRANCFFGYSCAFDTKMGRRMSFPHDRMPGNVLLQLGGKK